MLFVCNEAKEFVHDVKCIKMLLKLCKNKELDTNVYYELNYYYHKLSNWKSKGLDGDFIKDEIESLLNAIKLLLDSVPESKVKELLIGKVIVDLSEFDKLKYEKSKGFKGKIGITRNIYPPGFEDEFNNRLCTTLLLILFSPIIFIFVFCITDFLFPSYRKTLVSFLIIIYLGFSLLVFMLFMLYVSVQKIEYLWCFHRNIEPFSYGNHSYIYHYTRNPRKVEEITHRVLRARYILQNEPCLNFLLNTYNYYVDIYKNIDENNTSCVYLPLNSDINSKFFFDIYSKAEFMLNEYLLEKRIQEKEARKRTALEVENMVNEYVNMYADYIN